MGNTPKRTPVTPVVIDEDPDVQLWDEYVEEAKPTVKPWAKRLPDGSTLVVTCPTSEQLQMLGVHQRVGDTEQMVIDVFGEVDAPVVMELTAALPFTVRLKMINDVMRHYGMSLRDLPESDASST